MIYKIKNLMINSYSIEFNTEFLPIVERERVSLLLGDLNYFYFNIFKFFVGGLNSLLQIGKFVYQHVWANYVTPFYIAIIKPVCQVV